MSAKIVAFSALVGTAAAYMPTMVRFYIKPFLTVHRDMYMYCNATSALNQ